MIRVLVVDDHPAVRAGLVGLLSAEPGFTPVASAADYETALAEARRWSPDVVLVDYHLPPRDGLELCLELKAVAHPPRVVIYTAFADDGLVPAAVVAGADGLVDKTARADEVFEALRTVARGQRAMPFVRAERLGIAAARLDAGDLPILGMLMEQTSLEDVGATLAISEEELDRRVAAMVARLRVRAAHAPRGQGDAEP